MAQMLVEGGRPERNLRRACDFIGEAGRKGCEIVVLPECMDLGWTHASVPELAQPVPGKVSNALAEAARRAGIWVCSGLTERAGERFYNAAVLISSDGEILIKHRKINELDIAHHLYSPGDRLSVAQTTFGRVGVSICADNLADSLVFAHAMARMGAQIIVSPAAWAVPPDHDNAKQPYGETWIRPYTTIAKLYDIPVIGVSNVGWVEGGEWDGWKCIGCSLAIAADGRIITQAPYGHDAEDLIVIDVPINPPRTKWGTHIATMLKERGYEGP
jgi:predicted amidohydrolase